MKVIVMRRLKQIFSKNKRRLNGGSTSFSHSSMHPLCLQHKKAATMTNDDHYHITSSSLRTTIHQQQHCDFRPPPHIRLFIDSQCHDLIPLLAQFCQCCHQDTLQSDDL